MILLFNIRFNIGFHVEFVTENIHWAPTMSQALYCVIYMLFCFTSKSSKHSFLVQLSNFMETTILSWRNVITPFYEEMKRNKYSSEINQSKETQPVSDRTRVLSQEFLLPEATLLMLWHTLFPDETNVWQAQGRLNKRKIIPHWLNIDTYRQNAPIGKILTSCVQCFTTQSGIHIIANG